MSHHSRLLGVLALPFLLMATAPSSQAVSLPGQEEENLCPCAFRSNTQALAVCRAALLRPQGPVQFIVGGFISLELCNLSIGGELRGRVLKQLLGPGAGATCTWEFEFGRSSFHNEAEDLTQEQFDACFDEMVDDADRLGCPINGTTC